jgi:hypothetical protein
MSLIIPNEWRYGSPGGLDLTVINEFNSLVQDIASQSESWSIIELFKRKFNPGCGASSNESWARSDLHNFMHWAADNAPKFIAGFWAACEQVKQEYPDVGLPDADVLNRILAAHDVPYEIKLPHLVGRGLQTNVVVKAPEKSLDERAHELIRQSLDEADRLLLEKRPRAAVQEILWLLETVSTAFQGIESGSGTVEGKYFNDIVRDLRRHNQGLALAQIVTWMSKLHGFLSSPSGGGVRHGAQLAQEIAPTLAQAQLYCNLTKSYIQYLLTELAAMRTER